jgi:hypothetical protein
VNLKNNINRAGFFALSGFASSDTSFFLSSQPFDFLHTSFKVRIFSVKIWVFFVLAFELK